MTCVSMSRSENSSSLLCAEDGLGLDGDASPVTPERPRLCWDFSLNSFPAMSDECVAALVRREAEHVPVEDYAARLASGDVAGEVRRHAVEWIGKVHGHYGFAAVTAALSVNYLDRFLCVYELPQGKAWMAQLLSVACLSLAAKMEETLVPLLLDLQLGESKFLFEGRTVRRMELLVASTLKWRLQAVTPFLYIDYFLDKFNGDGSSSMLMASQSVDLIMSTIRGTDFLNYRPSEIAASVALAVLTERKNVDTRRILAGCSHVKEERVMECCELIRGKMLRGNPLSEPRGLLPASPAPQSPIGVLDAAACSSHSSDSLAVGSHSACFDGGSAVKRRKIGGLLIS